jgi:hypothetical protein
MKKSLVAVAALLLLGLAIVATMRFMGSRHAAPDLQGFWEGALSVKNSNLRLVLKVEKSPDGGYTATLDSIDQGAANIPVETLTLSNDTVRAELTPLHAAFEGQLDSRVGQISGEWRQAGMNFPLTLKRTTRPSTVAAPLSAAAYARRQDSPLQGWWKGTINAGAPLRVMFKISGASPGKYRGTMDSLDQGSRNLPLTSVEFAEPTVRIRMEGIGAEFEGTLKAGGGEIDGNWMQAGQNFPLTLQRTEPAEEASPGDGAYAFTRDSELQGFWHGALEIQKTKLRLAFKIARTASGSYTATLDSLDQGAKDIPATSVSFTNSEVELEWKALRALFHGRLEGGKLTGFWQQGAEDFPLDLERTKTAGGKVGK